MSSPCQRGTPIVLWICAPMIDAVSPTSLARVGGEHGGALLDDLAEHAAGDRDRVGRPAAPHACADRDVARRAPRAVVVLAQGDGEVRRAAHEREDALGHDVDQLVDLERARDLLLRVVERVQDLGVGAEVRLEATELGHASHGHDARVVDVLLEPHLHAHGALRVSEQQDVLVAERHLAARALGDVEHLAAAQHAGAVRALEIAHDVVVAREHDRRVLARDVPLGDREVGRVTTADPEEVCSALELLPLVLSLHDLHSDHRVLVLLCSSTSRKTKGLCHDRSRGPLGCRPGQPAWRVLRRAWIASARLSMCCQIARPSSCSRSWSMRATASGLPLVAVKSRA
jgi:hypothetical protein